MQSLVLTGARKLQWRDVSDPRLRADGDVIVRPIVSATCDLDRRIIAGRSTFQPPFAIGHEAVAEVVSVGDAPGNLRPGDVVVVPWHISCGSCSSCVGGSSGACENVAPLASFGSPAGGHWGGLFDELVRVPWARSNLVVVPDAVDPTLAAATADNLTDAYNAVRPTLSRDSEVQVLVVGGTASLGHMVVLTAVALQAARTTYVDTDFDRCHVAAGLGAIPVHVDEYPTLVEGRFDLVVDASANLDGLRCALLSTRPEGTCVVRSVFFDEPSMPYLPLYAKGIKIVTGPPHITANAPGVLAMVAEGQLNHAPILAGPFSHDDAIEVLLDPPAGKPQFCRPRLRASASRRDER